MIEQVMKLECCGKKYTIKRNSENHMNPYYLYTHTFVIGRYGYLTEHQKLVDKYADVRSCLLQIASDDAFSR